MNAEKSKTTDLDAALQAGPHRTVLGGTSDDFLAAVAAALPVDIRENAERGQWWLGDAYVRRLQAHGLAGAWFDGQASSTWITDLGCSVGQWLKDQAVKAKTGNVAAWTSEVQDAIDESVRYNGVHRWMYTEDLDAAEIEAIKLCIEAEYGSHTDTKGDILVYTGEKNGKGWKIFLAP